MRRVYSALGKTADRNGYTVYIGGARSVNSYAERSVLNLEGLELRDSIFNEEYGVLAYYLVELIRLVSSVVFFDI